MPNGLAAVSRGGVVLMTVAACHGADLAVDLGMGFCRPRDLYASDTWRLCYWISSPVGCMRAVIEAAGFEAACRRCRCLGATPVELSSSRPLQLPSLAGASSWMKKKEKEGCCRQSSSLGKKLPPSSLLSAGDDEDAVWSRASPTMGLGGTDVRDDGH
ncbi:hypothetical protein ACLOJK_029082 [Asimina triloba]